MTVRAARLRRLRAQLGRYDVEQVAEVGARVRAACVTARPEDAEEFALVITRDVLRARADPSGAREHRARRTQPLTRIPQ